MNLLKGDNHFEFRNKGDHLTDTFKGDNQT